MFSTILRYLNTIKYLELKQIFLRIFFKIYFPNLNLDNRFKRNKIKIRNTNFLEKKKSFDKKKFTFLNISFISEHNIYKFLKLKCYY